MITSYEKLLERLAEEKVEFGLQVIPTLLNGAAFSAVSRSSLYP
jgi:hypothetical protein